MYEIDYSSQSFNMSLCAFAKRDFINFRGLPKFCSLTDVMKHFPKLKNGCGQARLGQNKATFVMVAAEGFCKPIRLWLSGTQVLVLDVAVPELGHELPRLLAMLGQPMTKLDCYLGLLPYEEAEWVYPERGVTIFVNPESQRLHRIAVFRATTMEIYKAKFRVNLRMRRYPSFNRRS